MVVLGASGGLGASTWSAALARRLSLHLGECVLVDADLRGGGLDMTCGIEHVPGLRWPDLARLRGTTSCERLVAALPTGEVPVLSAGGRGGAVVESVVADVLDSLRGIVPVVLDVPARGGVGPGLWADASAVHVVAGVSARQLADVGVVLSELEGSGVGLVTRSDGALPPDFDEVLEELGPPHLAHVRTDQRVRRDGECGEWPGARGPLRDSADRVALDLVEFLAEGVA
ncbi:hypothetical protein N801_16860 [Knoellia aerolata DSM 18566]|uniref:Flp pilus assembly protein FlpE n=1 Tax=Knoellia aerolata DSM 18566 TaxID=1385519 RepID=A0A0A0JVA6_9MICO|nr:hypothetical protein N801_16860 [Knoellia aerolata DSM 18566]